MVRNLLKIIFLTIAILLFGFIVFIIYSTISDYNPPPEEIISESTENVALNDSIFTLITWNIGYAGLGEEMDFFYDGGKQTRCAKAKLTDNLNFVRGFLSDNDLVDFFLLQEVDVSSKRSYYANQVDSIKRELSGRKLFWACNYKVPFVPVPLSNPLGKVKSGLLSIFKYDPDKALRVSFPGNYSWPKRLFMLDRCFAIHTFNLQNGKKLTLINTHNSAFDDGSLRDAQMKYLKKYLQQFYQQGDYVIVGGDWNQLPPNFNSKYAEYLPDTTEKRIPENYLDSSWQWTFDTIMPTNRNLDKPYDKSVTQTKTIDFYLLSPNVQLVECKAIDLNFKHSDHQPLYLKIKLRL